jgi:hypothetical protein
VNLIGLWDPVVTRTGIQNGYASSELHPEIEQKDTDNTTLHVQAGGAEQTRETTDEEAMAKAQSGGRRIRG